MDTVTSEFFHLSSLLSGRRRLSYQFKAKCKLQLQLIISRLYLTFKISSLLTRLYYFRQSSDIIVLNVGCGAHILENAINLDLPSLSPATLFNAFFLNVETTSIFPISFLQNIKCLKNSSDMIILSHVLEHLPPHTIIDALKILHSYLKLNGIIRISVPAFESYSNLDLPVPPQQGYSQRIISINSLAYNWSHLFMYDKHLLHSLLLEAGFEILSEDDCINHVSSMYEPENRFDETIVVVGIKS